MLSVSLKGKSSLYDGSEGPVGLTFFSPPDLFLTFPFLFHCVLTTCPLCSPCIMPNMFLPQGLCTYYSLCKDKPSLDVHMVHFLISGHWSNVILSKKKKPSLVTLSKIATPQLQEFPVLTSCLIFLCNTYHHRHIFLNVFLSVSSC